MIGVIAFLHTGLGLLELDIQTCDRFRSKSAPELIWQALFRTCEVTSRITILAFFAALTRIRSEYGYVFYALLFIDIGVSVFVVRWHSGRRNTFCALMICSVVASFANVFRFCDPPQGREFARQASCWLSARHGFETIAATFFFFFALKDWTADLFDLHTFTIGTTIMCTLLYWLLWFSLPDDSSANSVLDQKLFSVVKSGDVEGFRNMCQ